MKKELTLSEAGRLGGLKGGKACVPKGFAVNRKAIHKAHATQRKKMAVKRKEQVERAAKNTVRSLAGIVGSEAVAAAILLAVRQKRVCHLLFKAKVR
jgi:hypothetical protein